MIREYTSAFGRKVILDVPPARTLTSDELDAIRRGVAKRKARLAAAAAKALSDEARKAKKRAPNARAAFERSPAWKEASARVRLLQPWCTLCGATEQLQADHIKPKSRFPELALEPSNLQTLCWPCNRSKAAR